MSALTARRPAADSPAWYVAYGSNLSFDRFSCYLTGGRPPGAQRTYTGCLDRTPVRRWEAVEMPGRLAFAGRSSVWGGGIAVYDPQGTQQVLGRAYLLTHSQVCDVVAQETRQQPGARVDLPSGHSGGTGLYDEVVRLADRHGVPAYTLASGQPIVPVAPTAAYLRTVLRGLHETVGWGAGRCAGYLAAAAGVAPRWSHRALRALHPHAAASTPGAPR